jgi:hypothetical protein
MGNTDFFKISLFALFPPPPQTRLETWLDFLLYYAEIFKEFCFLMRELDRDHSFCIV